MRFLHGVIDNDTGYVQDITLEDNGDNNILRLHIDAQSRFQHFQAQVTL